MILFYKQQVLFIDHLLHFQEILAEVLMVVAVVEVGQLLVHDCFFFRWFSCVENSSTTVYTARLSVICFTSSAELNLICGSKFMN